jgi:hypothetical protein
MILGLIEHDRGKPNKISWENPSTPCTPRPKYTRRPSAPHNPPMTMPEKKPVMWAMKSVRSPLMPI